MREQEIKQLFLYVLLAINIFCTIYNISKPDGWNKKISLTFSILGAIASLIELIGNIHQTPELLK